MLEPVKFTTETEPYCVSDKPNAVVVHEKTRQNQRSGGQSINLASHYGCSVLKSNGPSPTGGHGRIQITPTRYNQETNTIFYRFLFYHSLFLLRHPHLQHLSRSDFAPLLELRKSSRRFQG